MRSLFCHKPGDSAVFPRLRTWKLKDWTINKPAGLQQVGYTLVSGRPGGSKAKSCLPGNVKPYVGQCLLGSGVEKRRYGPVTWQVFPCGGWVGKGWEGLTYYGSAKHLFKYSLIGNYCNDEICSTLHRSKLNSTCLCMWMPCLVIHINMGDGFEPFLSRQSFTEPQCLEQFSDPAGKLMEAKHHRSMGMKQCLQV